MNTPSFGKINLWKAYSNEYKSLLKLGLPVLATELGIIVMSFADTMMVGAYGTNELASAAFVNNFFMVAVLMLIGFASGVTPIAGAFFSAGRHDDVGKVLRVSLQLNLTLAIIISLIMGSLYFFIGNMGQPPELLPLIRPYYLIVLCTLIPTALFNCCQQTANGVTDTLTPMWIILGANAINIFGNWLLIFGNWGFPEMGLTGAGLSTLISRILGMTAIIAMLLIRKRYRPFRNGLLKKAPLGSLRRKVLKTSYPVMFQSGIECLLWSFGAVVCGWFGTIQLAAYQVTVTMSQLGFMTYISFGIAVSIRVANFMGTKNFAAIPRIANAGLHINLLLGTAASAMFFFAGRDVLGLFTEDSEVIAGALLLIPPLILYQYVDAIQITYANALRGTSNVMPLLWVSILSYIAVGIPLLLLFGVGFGTGNIGVYYSFSGALLLAAILLYSAFRRTIRRHIGPHA